MNYPIRLDAIAVSLDYHDEVVVKIEEAKEYLSGQSWCKKINNGWLFVNLGKVICIFLYEIENVQSPEDNLVWIIVGDIPPMYLDVFNVPNSKEVVDTYVYLADDWLEHVKNGNSLDECFPLLTSWTDETLVMLTKRISILRDNILPEIEDIAYTARLY